MPTDPAPQSIASHTRVQGPGSRVQGRAAAFMSFGGGAAGFAGLGVYLHTLSRQATCEDHARSSCYPCTLHHTWLRLPMCIHHAPGATSRHVRHTPPLTPSCKPYWTPSSPNTRSAYIRTCILSLTYWPSYRRPSLCVNVPNPVHLLFTQEPSYRLPSAHVINPYPVCIESTYSPSYLLHKRRAARINRSRETRQPIKITFTIAATKFCRTRLIN